MDNKTETIVEIDNLTVAYGNTAVLWQVNAQIPKGSLVAIVGPNGAGKSTLIKTIMGIIKPTSGKISIFGKHISEIEKKHKKISYMPQRDTLDDSFPVSCLDVVLMGRYGHLGWFRRPSKEDKQQALDALEKFGMRDFANRQIGELSGGQKQRVLLARTFVQDAEIIFLDEPFGGIDMATENIILELLKELRDKGVTVIVITHDLGSLRQHFDYTWLLNIHTIAFGKTYEVLTSDNLEHCYGGTVHSFSHNNIEGEVS